MVVVVGGVEVVTDAGDDAGFVVEAAVVGTSPGIILENETACY